MVQKNYVDLREHEAMRAQAGEAMWVLVNHIHADKRNEFEHFLHAILMPAVAHTHPEIYNKTRVLHPTASNEDGSYTYIFLMDPLVKDGVYNVREILMGYYNTEQVEEYMRLWDEALLTPQIEYDVIQSVW
jgi:hypothetical protein